MRSIGRLLFYGLLAAALPSISPASARSADCLVEIDGAKIVDGLCEMTPTPGAGSFELATLRGGRVDHVVAVDVIARGRAVGRWNGARSGSDERLPLGDLTSAGACWRNARARVCAWKLGEARYFAEGEGAPPARPSEGVPHKVGQCVRTQIAELASRLEGAPDSGSAVAYANGIVGVSYDVISAIRRSRVGDPIILCLVSLPTDCPPGDDRGKVYSAVNGRTGQGWSLPDSQHMCGGA